MTTLILSTAVRYLLPLLLLLAVDLLLVGHNTPGGGFVGGLVASAAFALYGIAGGLEAAQRMLRIDPLRLIGLGLLTAALSAGLSLVRGLPFMTGIWVRKGFLFLDKAGTPVLFDFGVFMVVMGVALKIVFTLMEE